MKKRVWSILLALCMVLALLPFGALAAEDFSVYKDMLSKKMAQTKGDIYGTFFDLDQDGSSEMILALPESSCGEVTVNSSVSGGIDRSLTFGGENDHDETVLAIVAFPDGAYGLLMHNVVYSEPVGKDEEGFEYYWADVSDSTYKAVKGDLKEQAYMDSHVLQTKPDADGNLRYSQDGMLFSVNGQPASEKQYDSAFDKHIGSLEILMVLSPFQQLDGLHESEMLALTETGFYDVPAKEYFAEPVMWAAANGITNGTDDYEFSPANPCTRGQVVTFLWRAAGSPAPKSTKNPFKDVSKDAYYYKAVLWAVEQGITNGTSSTTFSPERACTRSQVVTFLYRNAGTPAVKAKNPFKDVKSGEYYYNAVLWAVKNEITNGTSSTTFSPNQTCTRGQIVTFLYRGLAK